jgi:hypothetical protein
VATVRTVLAIDPGTTESAFIVWNGRVVESGFISNEEVNSRLFLGTFAEHDTVAIEMIASYGMPVGKETFETCVWIGRFIERSRIDPVLIYRKDVKMHLCQSMRAKDANISQALRDKHGEKGTKDKPGPLYGVSKHVWAALAVADYALSLPPRN